MTPSPAIANCPALLPGQLRHIHHLALNVKDMDASRQFYGGLLGLRELTGDEVDDTLKELVATGKVANFVLPDGLILDLFGAPNLEPPDPNPDKSFTRAYHLAFDIDPAQFDGALAVLEANQIDIAYGPVTRPTGRGVYFYDPDGFMVEIRCDPVK
ncbi:VOC family protein [Nodosilinea sp. LEGE 07088]|uniref:VOC family protein n=1 Tax=Nodosilinea sp. LEGE 07088 TaxID=2777968 RepID=UPI00187F0EBF|nr:VOC family protein [Nodosilinea sp. LEGE 07088]MBE9140400.1 VOC family protein [Nodosilinea sp. LEGE 07088]